MPATSFFPTSFCVALHAIGTLGGDLNFRFTVPADCSLVHISAVNSAAAQAGLTVGNSDTAAAYLAKASVGASNVPVEFVRANFVTTPVLPHILKGTIVVVAIDHDYNGGGAGADSADLKIVFTFSEG
jgi:hypothetical protein